MTRRRFVGVVAAAFLFAASALAQSTVRNPVIAGFHPDPSVVRVGEDYYLVNSSFEYFPGVPVFRSRDLVNWKQIGFVLSRPSQLPLAGVGASDGIYAPTIRFHDGLFYVFTTLVGKGERRNFYVTAKDPAGPWSEPVFVDQSGIDPSIFWDDDGRAYFHSNRGMKFSDPRGIYVSEIDLRAGRRLTEPRLVWRGSGGSYVEGPHIYRRAGWYYLLAAEGGTAFGHMVTIARSRSVYGPYESAPNNPILSNRFAYGTVQGAGHADLVDAPDGSTWMVHLAFRTFLGQFHVMGRETFLAKVAWGEADGWPRVNADGTAPEILDAAPPGFSGSPKAIAVRNEFDRAALSYAPLPGLEWQFLRNPAESGYDYSARPGFLRLKGSATGLSDEGSPTFVARRQQDFRFAASTSLDFAPAAAGETAGMTLYMTGSHHYDLYVGSCGAKRCVVVDYRLGLVRQRAAEIPLAAAGRVRLRVDGEREFYRFSFAQGSDPWREIAKVDSRFLSTEVTGGYNGVMIGLFASGNGRAVTARADFDWFEYEPGTEKNEK